VLLAEARQRGAASGNLEITTHNAPAFALGPHFGFSAAHDYWYRGCAGEHC
jgi:hypothetical protein